MVAGEIACFRQRSASCWPATSPCAREGFHPRRKVVGIRRSAYRAYPVCRPIQEWVRARLGNRNKLPSHLRIYGSRHRWKKDVFRLPQEFKRMHCVDRNETILCMVVVRAGAIGKKLLVKLNSPSSSPPARALLPDGSVACPEDPLRETAPSGPRCWQFGTELRKFGRPLPAPSARAAVDQRRTPPYSSG